MSISLKTHKMLWGRAANRCAICQRELVIDATETDDESIIGEACHMIAKEIDGPRGKLALDSEKRDLYSNLILLCNVHHKMIDDQPNTYTVEKLKEIKADHEKWVQNSLQGFDSTKQRDDEIYASYIEEWARLADLNNWTGWSSHVLTPRPELSISQNENLTKLGTWLLSRIWPKRYEELEASLMNFRHILADFMKVFHIYSEPINNNILRTAKFYQISTWDPPRYKHLLNEYEFHVDLVQDLMFELTRATNYICDKVRLYIATNYRIEEGVLLIERGPDMDMNWRYYRTEYKGIERVLYPYPQLDKFKEIRATRDISFGNGLNPEDALNI